MAKSNTAPSYKPDVHDLFMFWLLTPKADRVPKTQGEFARSHKVDPTTLSRWKRDPKFVKQIFKRTPFLVAYEWGEILRGVIESCKDGNVSSVIFLADLLDLKSIINYSGSSTDDSEADTVEHYKTALDKIYGDIEND